jgi:uncharacterized membrane protein YdfJ with MMPL/SSD domain
MVTMPPLLDSFLVLVIVFLSLTIAVSSVFLLFPNFVSVFVSSFPSMMSVF